MKKRVSILLALLTLLLPGCGAPEAPQEKSAIKIGVALYDQYDTFISELMGYFTDAARAREADSGVTITVLRESADGNQEAQNNQVENFINAGCDVLCVNLFDRMDAAMIIDKAEAAGIPVIFFNRELVADDLQRNDMLYYVGADAAESGRMQGEIVAKICGYTEAAAPYIDEEKLAKVDKNGDRVVQYVMLEGEPDHQDAIVRTETSIKAMTDAGFAMERLEDETANWMRSQAESKMQGWLRVHGGAIEVVFANNDDMALGAIDALKRAEIPSSEWPVIVGIDGTSVGRKAVVNGELAGTVYNDAKGQGEGLLALAFALSTGGELPALTDGKYIRLPYQVITPENVMEFAE